MMTINIDNIYFEKERERDCLEKHYTNIPLYLYFSSFYRRINRAKGSTGSNGKVNGKLAPTNAGIHTT